MNFSQAVQSGFKKTLDFSGRASRSEFWWWHLFAALCINGSFFLDTVLFKVPFEGSDLLHRPIAFVVCITLFLPDVAVSVRRLHDINRTGWWMLIYGVPLIGTLILLVFSVRRGTHGINQYGLDPLYPVPD